jgi:hypothetical protein
VRADGFFDRQAIGPREPTLDSTQPGHDVASLIADLNVFCRRDSAVLAALDGECSAVHVAAVAKNEHVPLTVGFDLAGLRLHQSSTRRNSPASY